MSKHFLARSIILIALAFFLNSCATSRHDDGGDIYNADEALERAKEQNTPDARRFEAIDGEYRKRQYDKVIKSSKDFIEKYRKSNFLDQVHNLRGLAFIALKQYQNALASLKKALEVTGSRSLYTMVTYNVAYVHFELGQIDQAYQNLETIKPTSLDALNRMKFYILRAKIARLRQDYGTAARDILMAIRYVPDNSSSSTNAYLAPMQTFLDEVLESVTNIVVLEKLLSDFEDSPAADRLLFRVGNHYFSAGDHVKAKAYLERLLSNFPESPHYAAARENIRRVDFQSVVDSKKIGVLLTLSGKFGTMGYKALQGIELALKIFQPNSDGKPVSIIVVDDQGDPARATAAMEELFYKHHVAAVIGPMSSKLADPVGKKAQELGIPLVALTQKEASGGDFVFNAGLTPAMQVNELVQYAIEKAGVKNFTALVPSSKFGDEYGRAFWEEIARVDGNIRGFESYPSDETDFRLYVDRLVGLANPDARARELEELKLLKAATPIKMRNKRFDRMFDLKPFVDFEAVFIPDEPKTLGQILPTFAYRDVEKVLFLGINTWNSPELIARAGQFAEGSVFVDGFYAGSQKPSLRKFVEEYRATFSSEPGLMEALAYDAAHILASILKTTEIQTRPELRDKIMGLRGFSGVTGKISYQSGRLNKRLQLLTVKNGKIEEIAFQ